MTNKKIIFKKSIHILIYLIEVVGISLIITFITNKYWVIKEPIDFIERMTVFYTLYQILIYGILQHISDIKKDEYLALLSMYKYLEIYNNDRRKIILDNISSIIEKQLDSKTLNDINIRKEYLEIKKIIKTNKSFDPTIIKIKILEYEHHYEAVSLNWNYSLLLRVFK